MSFHSELVPPQKLVPLSKTRGHLERAANFISQHDRRGAFDFLNQALASSVGLFVHARVRIICELLSNGLWQQALEKANYMLNNPIERVEGFDFVNDTARESIRQGKLQYGAKGQDYRTPA